MTGDEIPYCIDGCGKEATAERFVGVMVGVDLVEVVELVCVEHARTDDPALMEG